MWIEKYFFIVKRAFVLVHVSLAVWSTRPCDQPGRVVDQAVLENRPLRKHFTQTVQTLLLKTGTAQNLAIENSKCQWENAFILVSLHSFFDMKNN